MRENIDIDALAAACAALGIDIDTLPAAWREPQRVATEHQEKELPLALSDAEWASIAALLPAEPAQADARANREVFDKALWVVIKGKRWTELGEGHEGVRRKFGRWAHLGVWQRLAAAAGDMALPPERQRQLVRLGQRAQRLAKN